MRKYIDIVPRREYNFQGGDLMNYISAQDAANKWGISKRRVQTLCASHRIENAVRVGNMWILPEDAEKPADRRIKHKRESTLMTCKTNPIRDARNQIKAISTKAMELLLADGRSPNEAKMEIVSIFASELLAHYAHSTDTETSYSVVCQITESGGDKDTSNVLMIRNLIKRFISQYGLFCDDSLSWCYQYINKIGENTQYSTTQFFTEKYMVSTLVDSLHIKLGLKLMDPACGGGNFLLYCFDVLAEEYLTKVNRSKEIVAGLNGILENIYGYEIDPCLAVVASINLRLKCVAFLEKYCGHCDIYDFSSFSPQIFFPVDDTIGGALDASFLPQTICMVGKSSGMKIQDVFQEIDIIVTNPPFQTVKGMDEKQKEYLKHYYPQCKCDMCNAFIELSSKLLKTGGKAGMVTQNSWMYLDSFTSFRETLLSECAIQSIWELGSNAFYDLNGEKTNVALLRFENSLPQPESKVKLTSLNSMDTAQIEDILSSGTSDDTYSQFIPQADVLNNAGARFDMVSSTHLRDNLLNSEQYGAYAVPMQGTSTGDSKNLIRPFWEHIGDPDWRLVSKGGGYARWQGLNHYCVKWGKDGEYIKAIRGSAIRNARYFNETKMVFSDTGTAGLNVRELLPEQIFVASGPGIRIQTGDHYAHLAFLNSRYASYYIRLLSPKLTIAAGYIAKIPLSEKLVNSKSLSSLAKQCVDLKKRRLAKRPYNIEFNYLCHDGTLPVKKAAYLWLRDDLYCEWTQLELEEQIDQEVFCETGMTKEDIGAIDEYLGSKVIYGRQSSQELDTKLWPEIFMQSLDYNCDLKRTKATKKSLGCDGIIEFLSQKLAVSCEAIYNVFFEEQVALDKVIELYQNLYFHALVMSAMRYKEQRIKMSVADISLKSGITNGFDLNDFKDWIRTEFNIVHRESFLKCPIYYFDKNSDMILPLGEQDL